MFSEGMMFNHQHFKRLIYVVVWWWWPLYYFPNGMPRIILFPLYANIDIFLIINKWQVEPSSCLTFNSYILMLWDDIYYLLYLKKIWTVDPLPASFFLSL